MCAIFNNRILIIDDNEAIHEDFKKSLILTSDDEKDEMEKLENQFLGKELVDNKIAFERPVFDMSFANQGQIGINHVRDSQLKGLPFALTFVDMRMPPGLDGIETIEQIWQLDPNIQTVICTAYSDYSWEDIFKRLGHSERLLILKKPFDIVEVRLMALALTKKWVLNQQANLKLNELQEMVNQKTIELQNSLSLTQATLESTADGIIVVDKNKQISHYNQKFLQMWDIPELLASKSQAHDVVQFMLDKMGKDEEIPIDIEQIDREKRWETFRELRLKTDKFIELFLKPHYSQDEKVGIVYSFRDVSQRKRLEMELAKQATFDFLTGLPNRVLLVDRIQQAIVSAQNNKTCVAVLLIDLDSFKLVNDSFGHALGDDLLNLFGRRLQECVREDDSVTQVNKENVIARLGGDEFVIVVNLNSAEAEKLNPIIQRFYKILLAPYQFGEHTFSLGLSVGVSFYPNDGDNASTLIKKADIAMYHAKSKGKGGVEYYTCEMEEIGLPRLTLEHDLRQAILNNELFVEYQPMYDFAKNQIVSFEALVRWNHPKLGLLGPVTFIPIAETSGLIISIGEWVLKQACAQTKAWQDMHFSKIRMSVNVSGYQFAKVDLVEIVQKVLNETGLESKYLDLEITESTILTDVNGVFLKIKKLNELSINVNIDDFGTGYSSLSYIKQFPIDKIKIDRSFVKDLGSNDESKAIVEAILMIANSLKLKVVAEGVETEEQLNILRSLAVNEIQGFLFSKPISAVEAGKLLQRQTASDGSIFGKD